jgi:hypothetical protein
MVDEPTLFDTPAPTTPAVRATDPETSAEAAAWSDRARQRWHVLERFGWLQDSVLLGFTDEELARACQPFIANQGSVAKRRLELERNVDKDGRPLGEPLVERVVVDGEPLSRPSSGGAPMRVYRITAAGRALLAKRRREGFVNWPEVPGS